MKKTVDDYLDQHPEWADILTPLRDLLAATEMEETVKWGAPVYVLDGHNVIGMAAFQSHLSLLFFDGSYLADPYGVLINAQEGKTRGMRHWRFLAGDEVPTERVKRYVGEAIGNARVGRKTERISKPKDVAPPELLQRALDEDLGIQAAFEQLTPGRQREYCQFIEEAKREVTRLRRVEKIRPMILAGVGLNDKYR